MKIHKKALSEANTKIRSYWNKLKAISKDLQDPIVKLKKLQKPKVPTFSRHNKHKINRLKNSGWRKSRGWQCNKLTIPKIGYKRAQTLRYRDSSTGLLKKLIYNIKDIQNLRVLQDPTIVGVIAKKVGAKKRLMLLDLAEKNSVPLYIQKKR